MEPYRISINSYDALVQLIEKSNLKAVRLGCKPAVLTIVGTETKTIKNELTGFSFDKTFHLVTVTGETPALCGWKLVAAVEPQASGENLVSCVPGETVPPEYRTTQTHCDHCKVKRNRREVFILRHTGGDYTQVGRQCIADFLGGASPESILAYAAWGFGVSKLMSEAEGEFWGGSGLTEVGYNLQEFLKMTAAVIRKLGWFSRSAAQAVGQEGSATVDTVMWLLNHSRNADDQREKKQFVEKHNLCLEERDDKLATEALAWGVALPVDKGDYLYNLGVACRLGFVRYKTAGLVASLIAAYQRELDRAEELNQRKIENAKKVRVHLGTVGERMGFAQVKVVRIRSFDSDYGVRTLINFETPEGSTIVWWASGDTQLEEGEVLDITATVKKHESWKDIPQTVVQRVKTGLPKPKKKKAA